MTSLFRALRKGSIGHSSKHQKLSEDWALNKEPVIDGVTFYVKYLGSTLVDESKEEATNEAIKTVIGMAKASGRKLQRVGLTVSLRGIKVVDMTTEETHLEFSIYRISNCFVEASYSHVFAFIATNKNETMECHCFLCPKKKMAHAATLTIAQSFKVAYECWQVSHDGEPAPICPNNNKGDKMEKSSEASPRRKDHKGPSDSSILINFAMECEAPPPTDKSWVCFEDDDLENLNNSFSQSEENSSQHYFLEFEDVPSNPERRLSSAFEDEMYSERQPIIDLLCA